MIEECESDWCGNFVLLNGVSCVVRSDVVDACNAMVMPDRQAGLCSLKDSGCGKHDDLLWKVVHLEKQSCADRKSLVCWCLSTMACLEMKGWMLGVHRTSTFAEPQKWFGRTEHFAIIMS